MCWTFEIKLDKALRGACHLEELSFTSTGLNNHLYKMVYYRLPMLENRFFVRHPLIQDPDIGSLSFLQAGLI